MKKVASCLLSVFLLALTIAAPAQAAVTVADNGYDWERFKGQDITLNVYNWGLYISDGSDGGMDINKEFEELTGITVNYTTYDTNESMYAKIKSEFDTVVDKCQVRIVVGDEPNAELRKEANEVFNVRDERLKTMTDESVPVFYSCIMCQAFSPSHVCIVTPERLGLCGAVSWLDAKATNELDPQGPCQVVTKERCIILSL